MSWDVVVSNHEDWRNSMICKIATGEDKAQEVANARLIAAAPELLEACRAVLANAEDAESTCDDDGKEYSDIAKLRAVIAKAEGRTL